MRIQTHPNTLSIDTSDSVLVKQIAAGNQEAFELLVRRYQTPLFNFIRRSIKDYELAHDILQHVFFQLYLHVPKLSTNLSTLHTREPVKSWLYQVTWNRCMDELRRKRPLLFSELDLSDDDEDWSFLEMIPDPYPLPEEIVERLDLQRDLYQAIEALPSKFRCIVLLRYTSGLTFVEIGEVLHISQNTAKTYFQRARPLLRTALASQTQIEYHKEEALASSGAT
ncbi:MAG: sigma-70 family RNA polymerase sigma factor [Ktedonobacteraceae bacterium]|nr:sigma-70 family RNA polymerase sigma factor [Ktedonobacteraceae bacterium]